MPSAILSRTAFNRALPRAARQARGLHVDNTLNNVRICIYSTPFIKACLLTCRRQNFPFKYAKRTTFIAKSGAFMGVSFAIPFAAVKFKT